MIAIIKKTKLTLITREEQILDNLPEKESDGWSAPDVYWTEALRKEKSVAKNGN